MRAPAALAILVLCAVVLGAASRGADPVAARGGGEAIGLAETELVFQRGSDLWVVRADGKGLRRLTERGGQPAVSPDGRRIAFVRSESIWLMARDGSGQRALTSGHRDVGPEWSPDGTSMYFQRFVGKSGGTGFRYAYPIFRIWIDGSHLTQLTRPSLTDHGTCHDAPSVAANGRVIAYGVIEDCDHGVPAGIESVDPSGRRVSLRGFDLPGDGFSPDWSPDARRMAYAFGAFPDPPGIGVAALGAKPTTVYARAGNSPAWSSDGKWIAFTRGGARGAIWLVRPAGTGLRTLTTGPSDGNPAWLPPRR